VKREGQNGMFETCLEPLSQRLLRRDQAAIA